MTNGNLCGSVTDTKHFATERFENGGETMKKIKGRLLSLFLILVMAVSAVACGGAGSDGNGADADNSAANDAAAGDASACG